MADLSSSGKGEQRSGEDKGKKRLKKCFIANRDAYDRINYLYQARNMNMAFIKRHEISYKKSLEIVFHKTNGKSYQEVATIVGCSKNAAFTVCKKFFKFRTVMKLPRVGRLKKIKIPRHERSLMRVLRYSTAAHLSLAQDPENLELSRYYMSTAKRITDKLVLKIDAQMKQTICKCCHNLLIPGITARHRIRGKREKHLVITCTTCGMIKRQRTNNAYKKDTVDTVNTIDLKDERSDEGTQAIQKM